ncbi:MAG TPA: flagellar motor protein MotB [Solirubrobacteraceae bacterium]|jgi:chemotaxis protein MotB|nr:flagellar motor protein MotB [Solirubrobacteraceae bacterium]
MARGARRGRRRGAHKEEESAERWLLTYADMITLLMALFMVLFSISSVNISKVQSLQESLRAAFSGDILPGGKAIAKPGASANSSRAPSAVDLQSLVPITSPQTSSALRSASAHGSAAAVQQQQMAAQQESAVFAHIKAELDAYARAHGFSKSVQSMIEPQGLVIRVLTDDLLFESGQATLDGRSSGLLGEISQLLNVDETHPIDVEGNTDDVPIHGGPYPSNWELSTARASTVVRFLAEHGVTPRRLTATGYAEQHPLAGNATSAGRARNRRVEIVMKRIYGSESEP